MTQPICTRSVGTSACSQLSRRIPGPQCTTEKAIDEYTQLLTDQDREEIRADMEALKAVKDGSDPARIKEALQRLEGSAYRIADAIYSNEQKAGG